MEITAVRECIGMGPRFLFATLTLVFSLALVFATLTTVQTIHRHTSTTLRSPAHG
jgi:hypothetical protein